MKVNKEVSKTLDPKYIDVLERLDWDVIDYTDDGRVEIEKYSPAGEEFSVCVDIEDFPQSVQWFADVFDQDEHIEMWIGARQSGVSGVPSTRELVEDAAAIAEMLQELADALCNVDDEGDFEQDASAT